MFFKKEVLLLHGIYSIKNYHYSIINSIIILRFKLFKLAHGSSFVGANIASPTTGGETREECHKGRSSGKLVKAMSLSCEHWM